jgi:hypothetical protein
MKNIRLALLLPAAILFFACGADDNKKEWGNAEVYMPQAAILDGGISNNYPVPLNSNASTENYVIDSTTNTLKIVLGVYRSGLQPLEAFSVSVSADLEATQTAISSIAKGVVLPAELYTLPTSVQVENGTRESIFYLNVDLKKLLTNYPNYNKNKMVLVVAVNDPTKYELNESLAKTTVIIDGASFLPTLPIVEGGDFGSGSERYWTRMDYAGNLPASAAAISNGALVFDYGTGAPAGDVYFYNIVELEKGVDYIFSCDFTGTGGSAINNARFYLVLSPSLPTTPSYSADNGYTDPGNTFFTMIDAWNGMKNPVTGTLPQNGGWQGNIDKSTGIFTSNFSGTGYLIIGVAAWGSPIGRITVDNVKIIVK